MFKKCCSSRSEKNYKIHHSPRSIKLSEEMNTVIKKLLGIHRILIHTKRLKMSLFLIESMMNFHLPI